MKTVAYTVWGVEGEIVTNNWRDDEWLKTEIAERLGDPVTRDDVCIIRKT